MHGWRGSSERLVALVSIPIFCSESLGFELKLFSRELFWHMFPLARHFLIHSHISIKSMQSENYVK